MAAAHVVFGLLQGLVAEEDKLRAEIRDLENAARRFRATAGADAGTPPQEATLELKLAEYEAIHGKLQSADPRVASLQSLPLVTLAEVDSLVLECTNLPPYAAAVRRATGRPVHHLMTLVHERLESA